MRRSPRKGAVCSATWGEGRKCWLGVWARGLCSKHYNQGRQGKSFTEPEGPATTCAAFWPGGICGELATVSGGLCGQHASRKSADTEFSPPRVYGLDGKRVVTKLPGAHVSAMSKYAEKRKLGLPDVVRDAVAQWVSRLEGEANGE